MRDLAACSPTTTGWTSPAGSLSEATGVSNVVAGEFTIVGRGVNPSGQPEGWVAHLGVRAPATTVSTTTATARSTFPTDPGCHLAPAISEQIRLPGRARQRRRRRHRPPRRRRLRRAASDRDRAARLLGRDRQRRRRLVDFPADPGCASAQSPIENPECSNGIDDDGDGPIDHPADAQCVRPSDRERAARLQRRARQRRRRLRPTSRPTPQCVSNGDLSEHPQCSDGRRQRRRRRDVDYPAEYPDCVGADDPIEAAAVRRRRRQRRRRRDRLPGRYRLLERRGGEREPVRRDEPGAAVVDRTSRALFFVDTHHGRAAADQREGAGCRRRRASRSAAARSWSPTRRA